MEERDLMRIYVVVLALLLLTIPLASSQVDNSTSFRIGYSPEKLFSSELGIPSYLRGETIWLNLPESHEVELQDSNMNTIIKLQIDGGPDSIYKFKESDILGTWRLIIDGRIYELELADQKLQVEEDSIGFELVNNSLMIIGEIQPRFSDIPLESEVIVAKNRKTDFITVQTELLIEQTNTNIDIKYELVGKETKIFIQPYIENVRSQGEYSEIGAHNIYAWAELTSEIALVKKTDNSRFTTYVDGSIVETDRTYFEIVDAPRNGLNMTIPVPGLTDNPWTVPLKYGRASLSVYLEFEGKIFVNRIPVVILEDKLIINPELIIPVDSFTEKIEFREVIKIEDNMELEILLISKINGIDRIFYDTNKPEITKINVVDRTNNDILEKYELVFENDVKSIKIDETTYVIGKELGMSIDNFNTELFINSFRVFDQIIDTRMNEDGIIEILTDIGMARIQVIDSTGSISGNGEIIIRKLDTNNDEFLVTAWNGSDVSIMLPEGRYSAILESENIQGETEFEIFGDEKDVLIVVDSVYGMSTNIWIFALATIITIEIIIIYSIWKKNIKLS
uniref:Uncharacterized protein n=1 Tax=uncultured marine thaumarchaeote KM3_90_H07 TaxID=1456345 RepID=A0A075I1B1_9ARCH|nr:hypothetical protein [uncultured marine thaumarchaeote KM3_90_H07]